MSEEKWISDVLNSLEGAESAKAPDVFGDIQQKISQEQPKKQTFQWVSVAAVILIVLCSNVLILNDYFRAEDVSDYQDEYSELISNYTLYEDEW